jgi:lysophospholipase L1-like esterase
MSINFTSVIKNVFFYVVMVCCCLEIALRILGYAPFMNDDYSITAEPERAFLGHPKLGIQLNPGQYHITINNALAFSTHHLEGNTRHVPGCPRPSEPDVVLLGCSFTYGFGVNDDEHFTSLLQQEHPDLSFRNAGVVGYGTVQSLIQLQEQLSEHQPRVVLLNFSSFHFMRNTLSPQYRANLKIGYRRSSDHVDLQMSQARFPYKESCKDSIQYVPWHAVYHNFPGREWLASINWIQTSYDAYREDIPAQIEATACLLRDMHAICASNNIPFGVVGLDATPQTALLKSKVPHIPWVNVGFDFADVQLINHPHDTHPNPRGHQHIASSIAPFLNQLLHE